MRCPVCNSDNVELYINEYEHFYVCSCCGRFALDWAGELNGFNVNHLASYLFYNAFSGYQYHTAALSKELCDKYNAEFANGHNVSGQPAHLNPSAVESWYPTTFAERVDKILLYLSTHATHIGKPLPFSYWATLSLLFIDRKENDTIRKSDICFQEIQYVLQYLSDSALARYCINESEDNYLSITLMPKGLGRVDEIQKNTSYGRNALVAMKFGDDTLALREAIRQGIADAGYHAIFIDEVQHNDFITPEILKHIKNSRFVVVDLTHQNNGAYFEEGYAMGLGKTVIQLCQKNTKLHFDIAQKNTIMWEQESDIPQMLKNRIQATIE